MVESLRNAIQLTLGVSAIQYTKKLMCGSSNCRNPSFLDTHYDHGVRNPLKVTLYNLEQI